MLERQVKRMLADPRAEALVTSFADQWLYLRNLKAVFPDLEAFPDFDDNLRQLFPDRDRRCSLPASCMKTTTFSTC